jgi:hypothetical protein
LSDMRWSVAILWAVVLIGCGGGKGLSSKARLDPGHYRFGQQLEKPNIQGQQPSTASASASAGPVMDEETVSTGTAEPVTCDADAPALTASMRATGAPKTWPRTAQEPAIPERILPRERIDQPRPVQEVGEERTKWNLFALAAPVLFIVALAIAIPSQSTELLLIGCAIAFASAFIGARQCRERGERGQGFAMAVIGFALAGVLVATIALLSRL